MIVVLPAPFSPTSAMRSPGREREVHVPDGPPLAARILEADVLEHEARRESAAAPAARPAASDRRLHLEEDEQVAQVETLLVDRRSPTSSRR